MSVRLCYAVGLAACTAIVAGQPLRAQEDAAPRLQPSLMFGGNLAYRESFIAGMMNPFRMTAGPDQVLTAEDIARAQQQAVATAVASTMQTFFARDLNGDGRLDENEIGQGGVPARRVVNVRIMDLRGMDANNDGVVSLDEAVVFARQRAAAGVIDRQLQMASELLAADPNKDGQLTAERAELLARQAFASYDIDANGSLNQAEMRVLQREQGQRQQELMMQQVALRCDLPKASAEQEVIVVSAYESGTLTNVTVSGPDTTTGASELYIEPGEKPLYLLLTSYEATIWRITGDTKRVVRVVATAQDGNAGVTGLEPDAVTIREKSRCLGRLADGGKERVDAQAKALGLAVGKPIDRVLNAYELIGASLPSQARTESSWGERISKQNLLNRPFALGGLEVADQRTFESFRRFHTGGFVRVEAKDVVAASPAEAYDVLPQEAGLLQLLMDGSIERVARGYLVKKPIARFPAGLAGAHMVAFIIADGVPMPGGNPGHSAVWRQQKDGQLIAVPAKQFRKQAIRID